MQSFPKSIQEIEDELVEEFEPIIGDRESMVLYIMELGEKAPALEEKYKTAEHEIKGCQSKVWITTATQQGRVFFEADSNTNLTKGLISLLIRVLSGQKAEDVVHAKLIFLNRIGMNNVIGSQRSNGLAAMIQQMKRIAQSALLPKK